MEKRILSVCLTACMLLTLMPSAFAAYAEQPLPIAGMEQTEETSADARTCLLYTSHYLSFVLTETETRANAYTELYTYNIDLQAGRELTLRDMLGPDYKELANEAVRAGIAAQEAESPDNIYFHGEEGVEGFTSIADDQRFYINEAGNPVLIFEKYEIAPGYMGPVSYTHLRRDGPAGL